MKNTFIEIKTYFNDDHSIINLEEIKDIEINKNEEYTKITLIHKENDKKIDFTLNNDLAQKVLGYIFLKKYEKLTIIYDFKGVIIEGNDKVLEIDKSNSELYDLFKTLTEEEKDILKQIDYKNIKVYSYYKEFLNDNLKIILNNFASVDIFEDYKNYMLEKSKPISLLDYISLKFNNKIINDFGIYCLDIEEFGIKNLFNKIKKALEKEVDSINNPNFIYEIIKVYKKFLKYEAKGFLLEKANELNIDITDDNIIYYLEEIDKSEYTEIRIYTNDIFQDEIWSIEDDKTYSVIIDEDTLYEIYNEIKEK